MTALDFSKIDTEAFKSLQPVLNAHTPDPSKGVPIDVSDVADAIVFLASGASKKISGGHFAGRPGMEHDMRCSDTFGVMACRVGFFGWLS
jgi:hypothetical protein